MDNNKVAILALEDGSIFQGTALGLKSKIDYTCGEVVFNTSITGYQEIISDPSYCDQIILFTQPHIGNVGVNKDDVESNLDYGLNSKVWSKGIIIKSLAHIDSNWRSENSLNNYLEDNNLIGIAEIDTRALTILLREKGSQKACIYLLKNHESLEQAKKKATDLAINYRSINNLDLAKEVSIDRSYQYNNLASSIKIEDNKEGNKHSNKLYNIIVYDFGVKQNILKILAKQHYNYNITVVPAMTSYQEVIKLNPDGILLSNGPGDPSACDYAIDNTRKFIQMGMPIYGICLGYQILALALNARTKKMKFGHHGANHPVKEIENNRVYITSQNHGFMVDENSLSDDLIITHVSLFDNTVQGIRHKYLPVFGFQGHPEASPGPNDIEYLFDVFYRNIKSYSSNKNKINSVA